MSPDSEIKFYIEQKPLTNSEMIILNKGIITKEKFYPVIDSNFTDLFYDIFHHLCLLSNHSLE